jgi:tRNA threonylcarbamoyladenosine modification (KEOPS) complex Cgi121 subunit
MKIEKKSEFLKVSVKRQIKRAIDIIAAKEQRPVYQVVSDMLAAYEKTQGGTPSKKA